MNSGRRMIIGQALLIICCVFYLLWWYRGYRPGTVVNRMGGINGVLLAITAVFGISGIACCLMPSSDNLKTKINPMLIVVAGIAAYIVLFLVTRLFTTTTLRSFRKEAFLFALLFLASLAGCVCDELNQFDAGFN